MAQAEPMLTLAAILAASFTASEGRFLALDLPGSQLTALDADGQAAAGSLSGDRGGGFRWQAGQGARTLPEAISVRAISPDGRYVAGSSLDADQIEVASWWDRDADAHALAGVAHALGLGQTPTMATRVDNDLHLLGTTLDGSVQFQWSPGNAARRAPASDPALPACGARRAPTQPPAGLGTPMRFVAASDDGAVWVGHAGSGARRRAVIWTGAAAEPLDGWLRAHGVTVPGDWTLVAATAVDASARHVGGFGLHDGHFDSFIAALPATEAVVCTARANGGPRSTTAIPQ